MTALSPDAAIVHHVLKTAERPLTTAEVMARAGDLTLDEQAAIFDRYRGLTRGDAA